MTLIVVTKTYPASDVRILYELGVRQVAAAGRELQPRLNGEVERVVRELLAAPESPTEALRDRE